MTYFWLASHILFLIVVITSSANVGLRTQQGIIYGRHTQSTIEYLGYDDITQLNNFLFVIVP
jgi:hypothetical protein